jgi:hypothetical protein
MLARAYRGARLNFRSVAEWRELLERSGFRCEAQPLSEGTPFANVLLVARAVKDPS